MKYKIAIHHIDEGVSVSVPALPGCWSEGATEVEALINIEDAIREYLASKSSQYPITHHPNTPLPYRIKS